MILRQCTPQVRSEYALEWLRLFPRETIAVDQRIAAALTVEQLQDLVKQLDGADVTKPQEIPFSAAFVVAHRGVSSARPVLLRLADGPASTQASPISSARWQETLGRYLRGYVSMIDAQPEAATNGAAAATKTVPVELLDLVRGCRTDLAPLSPPLDSVRDGWLSDWAMERAITLAGNDGQAREAVRSAVTARVRQASGTSPGKDSGKLPALATPIKVRAIRLGLLTEADVPEVTVARPAVR